MKDLLNHLKEIRNKYRGTIITHIYNKDRTVVTVMVMSEFYEETPMFKQKAKK